MKIAILKERAPSETRVAASPDTIKQFTKLGASVTVETGAGENASLTDKDFKEAGATIEKDAKKILKEADIVLKIQPSGKSLDETKYMKKDAIFISLLSPLSKDTNLTPYAKANITTFALEMIPRITRAQSMDVLSSQSNLAGYKAVLDALTVFDKVVPMMMTAAGTVSPAKICIMGAGVAGLQAIATAKRLGGIVSAFDVRPAAKEQVESLGAKFVEVDEAATKDAETAGGYAKEMSAEYRKKQEQVVHEHLQKQDIVITTALIPGKPAPVLIPEKTVKVMKQGSVIVDLAVTAGGNCPLSKPNEIIEKHGVKIIGYENIPGRVSRDASKLFAKNLLNFVTLMINPETKQIELNLEDEIIAASMATHNGNVTLKTKG